MRGDLVEYRGIIFSVLLADILLKLPNLFAAFLPFYSSTGLSLRAFGLSITLRSDDFRIACAHGFIAGITSFADRADDLFVFERDDDSASTFLFQAMQETDKSEMSVFMVQGLTEALMTLAIVAVFVWLMLKRIPKGYRFPVSLRWLILFFLAVPVMKDLVTSGSR